MVRLVAQILAVAEAQELPMLEPQTAVTVVLELL
jgi:hypothetical protein